MNRDKVKSWLYVAVQFLLVIIILIAAPVETSLFNRYPSQALRAVSYIIISFSAVIFLWSLKDFRQSVSPNPIPSQRSVLRTNGIYSRIRHPMYSSLIFMNFGYTIYFNAYVTLFLCAILLIFFHFKVNFEEKHLSAKFPEYSGYRNKTKKFIPRVY